MSIRSALESRDLHDEAFARDPFPVWQRLRDEAPLFHDTVDDVYLLTRYEDVTAVLRDDVTYSTWIYKSWFATVMGETFAQYDGERHARERARVAPHLVGAPLDRLLRPAVDRGSGGRRGGPSGRWRRSDRTVHIPVARARDGRPLHDPRARAGAVPAARGSDLVGARRGRGELAAGVAARRELESGPRRGSRSALQASRAGRPPAVARRARRHGHGARDDYILSNVNFLSAAGSSTVDYALRNVLWALLAHPSSRRRRSCEGDHDVLDRTFDGDVPLRPARAVRGADHDAPTSNGTASSCPKGSIVRVALASATERRVRLRRASPVRPGRARTSGRPTRVGGSGARVPPSHLAFGLGSHFCAGYKLSRLEAHEGIVRLFRDRRPVLSEPLPPLRLHQYPPDDPVSTGHPRQRRQPMTDYPKYRALWPPYQSIPYGPGEEPRPTLLRAADHRFDAWAPAPGNATPSWTWVSTPHINAGMFAVPAGCWFDPGDHPNTEPYYILKGTLHLSNPDTSDVVELHAGDASNIPAWAAPPWLQLRRRGLPDRPGGAGRDAHRPLQGRRSRTTPCTSSRWYERKPRGAQRPP